MTLAAADAASGKTHAQENFPVASWLVAARHRPTVMAFYRFARAADDVADHPRLAPDRKLALLDRMEGTLLGRGAPDPDAAPLRDALAARAMSPRHPLDLLKAFRRDVTKPRTADWDDLMAYCAVSAAPVGRFVLDVHGEAETTWANSDAVCAALQINNHLQDCAKDFRDLDRVYVPLDALAAEGLGVEALGERVASPALRRVLKGLAERNMRLLDEGEPLAGEVRDGRLSLEIAVTQKLARRICALLIARDPLSERVRLDKAAMAGYAAQAVGERLLRRITGRR